MTGRYELGIGPDTAESAVESNSTLNFKSKAIEYSIFCSLRVKHHLQIVRIANVVL